MAEVLLQGLNYIYCFKDGNEAFTCAEGQNYAAPFLQRVFAFEIHRLPPAVFPTFFTVNVSEFIIKPETHFR